MAVVTLLADPDKIQMESNSHPTDGNAIAIDIVNLTSYVLKESDTFSLLSPCLRDSLEELSEIVVQISPEQQFDKSHHWKVLFNLGRCWTIVGMLEAFLLAPQGPVDPAHKLAVQLEHSEDQVCTRFIQKHVKKLNDYIEDILLIKS